jgi:16S rRNA (guanine966-N2)-methyltransferase
MAKHKKSAIRGRRPVGGSETKNVAGLRIIGGEFRGRKLEYSGDPRTRPMKDRVREALFNLLSTTVRGKMAIDLFAGTGALALEALSRGATSAIAIELHRPTVRLISQNAVTLGVESRIEVVSGNTFHWVARMPDLTNLPWVVFCSPPYEFYVQQEETMLGMLHRLIDSAPPESIFAVEADDRFEFGLLPSPDAWDIRRYPPAVLGIWEKSKP